MMEEGAMMVEVEGYEGAEMLVERDVLFVPKNRELRTVLYEAVGKRQRSVRRIMNSLHTLPPAAIFVAAR